MNDKQFDMTMKAINKLLPFTSKKLVGVLNGVEYQDDDIYFSVTANRHGYVTAYVETERYNAKFTTVADSMGIRQAVAWIRDMIG